MKLFAISLFLLAGLSPLLAEVPNIKSTDVVEYKEQCSSAKEYVTTLNFLRGHSEFQVKDSDATKVAAEISKGCNGASLRFIQIVNLLVKAGIDTGTAINTGKEFSFQTDEKTQTFISIFKGSYLKKFLDMDLLQSKKIALELTIGLKKTPEIIRQDFTMITDFCSTNKGLDLPKTECAGYALKVIKQADQFEGPIAPPFIDLFSFLTEDGNGPKVSTYDALKIAESVLKYGPMAKDNFVTAYRYALSSKGLGMGRADAIVFANQLAERSIPISATK